jgi:oxygen-dependent protoporphyrinogen oxidase
MKRVIVIGGGISGLAAAWFLRRRGIDATVLEAGAEPGGTVRTIERGGFMVDAGPTSTLFRGGALEELIAGVGLQTDVIEADRRAPRYIVKDDKLVALPAGPAEFFSTPLFSTRAKGRLLTEPFRWRARAEESIAQFTRRRIGVEFLDWAVDPFVSGVYAGDPDRLSVRAAIPRLYALEAQYGSLFVGALARMFRGDSGGTQPRGRLISLRRGMQTLPRALGRALGESLRLNTPATSIGRSGAEWIVRTAEREHRTERVVFAVPAYRAAELLGALSPELSRDLSAITYPPVASIALGFSRRQVADLRPLLSIQGSPLFENVTRWRHAIPQYDLGHIERIARVEAVLRSFSGLYVCANWRGGVSLADCVSNAEILAAVLAKA